MIDQVIADGGLQFPDATEGASPDSALSKQTKEALDLISQLALVGVNAGDSEAAVQTSALPWASCGFRRYP